MDCKIGGIKTPNTVMSCAKIFGRRDTTSFQKYFRKAQVAKYLLAKRNYFLRYLEIRDILNYPLKPILGSDCILVMHIV